MTSFRGGAHPREDKEATEQKPVEVLPLPARVYIPLSQHAGAPSKPVVQKGSPVKTGTLIGEPGGRISAATHASVSGAVADIADLPHPLTGRRGPTVIIDSDGTDTPDDSIRERDYSSFTTEQTIEAIRLAAVVGMGGAAFPTFFKLTPPNPKVYVYKGKRRLLVVDGDTLVREFRISLGFSPSGDKKRQGDGRTPEGEFYVCVKNANSSFYKSVGLSYPMPKHAEQALIAGNISQEQFARIAQAIENRSRPPWDTRLGGQIFIHGGGAEWDWTRGCIALFNTSMDDLFDMVRLGTPVTILP